MQWQFIAALILLVAFLLALAIRLSGKQELRENANLAMGVTGVLFVVLSLWASANYVDTKKVGVERSFGKPVDELDNGLHWTWPWHTVTVMDAAIQIDNHVGENAKNGSNCTSTRIAHQSLACVDNTVRWQIKTHAAGELFKDYHDLDKIRDSLVTRHLNAIINTKFSDVDPLKTDDKGNSVIPDTTTLAKEITTELQTQVGDLIAIKEVTIPLIRFDDKTQERINQLQAEVANTRIAEQKERTATATARANRELASSVSKDPNVLVSACMDMLGQMVKEKLPVPAGFSCWPGSNSAVVVPSAKQ